MYDVVKPVELTKALASSASLDGLLGSIWVDTTGKIYRLVKAGAAITAVAKLGLVTAYSAGVPTWAVGLPGGVVTEDLVFAPASQVGSTGTADLVSGDYFLAQISGSTSFITTNTTLVKTAGQALAVNSLGYVVPITAITVASLITYPGSHIYATNTAAITTTTGTVTGIIIGLL